MFSTYRLLRRHDLDGQLLCRRSFHRYMRWDSDLPHDLVDRIWQDPYALLELGEQLHAKLSCTVVKVEHRAGSFVMKCQDLKDIGRRVKRSLSRTTARRSMVNGHFLFQAGTPTPRPRAYVEDRIGPFRTRSYFLTDYVEGTTLYRFMRHGHPSRDVVHDLARQTADILQKLDDLSVCHTDFKTENLLVDKHGKVWLLDLERISRFRRRRRFHQRQTRDVRDLLHPRNWRADPGAAEIFRQAILQKPFATQLLQEFDDAGKILGQPLSSQNRASQLVTVLIPCLNNASTILACLDSVRDIADEILVADAGSTDETLELVHAKGGCQIIENKCSDPCGFLQWARQKAQHPWILQVLANERLNPELGRQVQDRLATEPREDGFRISRTPYLRGHPLRHGGFQDDSSIRLYRKTCGQYKLRDGQPEMNLANDLTGALRSRLIVDVCSSIEKYLGEKSHEADQIARHAHYAGRRASLRTAMWRAPARFFQTYILRSGWRDGRAGFHACCLAALDIYMYEMMLWDMEQPSSENSPQRQSLKVAA